MAAMAESVRHAVAGVRMVVILCALSRLHSPKLCPSWCEPCGTWCGSAAVHVLLVEGTNRVSYFCRTLWLKLCHRGGDAIVD